MLLDTGLYANVFLSFFFSIINLTDNNKKRIFNQHENFKRFHYDKILNHYITLKIVKPEYRLRRKY